MGDYSNKSDEELERLYYEGIQVQVEKQKISYMTEGIH